MEKLKLVRRSSGLVTVAIALVIAVLALFMTNQAFGWMAGRNEAGAHGMLVDVNSPDSSVHHYELYYVYDAQVIAEVSGNDEIVYNEYYFEPLPEGEAADIQLKNYSKLEAPQYHLLLHVSLEEGESGNALVDLFLSKPDGTIYGSYTNDSYTIATSGLSALTVPTAAPLGLSSALEFYVLDSSAGIEWTHHQIKDDDGNVTDEADVFAVRSDKLPEEGETFAVSEKKENGKVSEFTFSNVTAQTGSNLSVAVSDLVDVPGFSLDGEVEADEGDGYKDLFVFITYSSDLIGVLQSYGASKNSLEQGSFNFKSDIALRIRKDN